MSKLPESREEKIKICGLSSNMPCPFVYGLVCAVGEGAEEEIIVFLKNLPEPEGLYRKKGCPKLENSLCKANLL